MRFAPTYVTLQYKAIQMIDAHKMMNFNNVFIMAIEFNFVIIKSLFSVNKISIY